MIHLGLTGFPLGHSLSPSIHHAALQAAGLEGEFQLYPVKPADAHGLKNLMDRMRAGAIAGLSITIPYKQTLMPYMDELTPTARAIGAINTLYVRDGKLIGDNTDALGFAADLERQFHFADDEHKRCALILGAGGAARAVLYALLERGWQIMVSARNAAQSKKLADSFHGIEIVDLGDSIDRNIDLLVNATPLGMSPDIESSPWPEDRPLPKNAAVYDLVYNPRQTKLVRSACAQGLHAVTGLGMLVEQARAAFESWTGSRVDGEVLYNALESA